MMELFDQPLELTLPFVVSPGMAALFNHVSMLPSVPRWYSKQSHSFVGRAMEVATPCGDMSGSVASSTSRLYMRIWSWPPIRRCLFVPCAESGMVMKET